MIARALTILLVGGAILAILAFAAPQFLDEYFIILGALLFILLAALAILYIIRILKVMKEMNDR